MLLPGGMHVPIRLETRLDARRSATGDALVARTTSDITLNGVTIPAGSEVAGRIRDLRRGGPGKFLLEMDFWEIHSGETTVRMMVSLEQAEQRKGVERRSGSLFIDEKRIDISGLVLTYRTRGLVAGYTQRLP